MFSYGHTSCKLRGTHCENCGSNDPQDIDPFENDGYSVCCNELIVYGPDSCRNHHAELSR